MSGLHTVRGEDEQGRDVIVTMGVTRDKMIAIRRSTGGTIFLSPRAVSRYIDHLRELQAQALQGETWG